MLFPLSIIYSIRTYRTHDFGVPLYQLDSYFKAFALGTTKAVKALFTRPPTIFPLSVLSNCYTLSRRMFESACLAEASRVTPTTPLAFDAGAEKVGTAGTNTNL